MTSFVPSASTVRPTLSQSAEQLAMSNEQCAMIKF